MHQHLYSLTDTYFRNTYKRLCGIRSFRKRIQKNIYILLCSFCETDEKGWRKKLRSALSRFVATYKRVLYGEKNSRLVAMAIPYRFYHSQSKEQKRRSLFFLLLFFFVFEEKILSYKWREFVEEATPTNKRSSNNINNDECEVNNCQKKTRNPITKPFAVNLHMHYGLVYEGQPECFSHFSIHAFCVEYFTGSIILSRLIYTITTRKIQKTVKIFGPNFFLLRTHSSSSSSHPFLLPRKYTYIYYIVRGLRVS